jgi:hypothetical protein
VFALKNLLPVVGERNGIHLPFNAVLQDGAVKAKRF